MGLLTNRDALDRERQFWGLPLAMASGGAAASGAGLPWGAIASGGAAGLGVLGEMLGNGEEEMQKANRQVTREAVLIGLLQDEMLRQQQNRQAEAQIPLVQNLTQRILDPTQGNLLAANRTPRTYQSNVPGQASMTPPTMQAGQPDFLGRPTQNPQYGAPASPEQLSQLVPNFSQAQQQRSQQVSQLTAGITPQAYQRDSTLPLLNQFDLTRGSYLSGDNGVNEAGEESLVSQLAQGQTPQQVAPGGRAPFRGPVSQMPTSNQRGDGYSDEDIRIMAEAQKNGMNPVELEMLKRKLWNDGR